MNSKKNNVVVCNGGIDASTVLDKHMDHNHYCLQILNGDMSVADTLNPSKGLHHTMPCGMPTFNLEEPGQGGQPT